MKKIDIDNSTLRTLCFSLRNGALTSSELAQWSISNHELIGKDLNAYKTWDKTSLFKQAQAVDAVFDIGVDLGALQGIPISIKDLFGVKGYPIYAGCPRPLPKKWEREGPVIRSIRRQLGLVAGKSHTVQFAFGGMGFNQHWGAPHNPWDISHHRSPGGSSSGAGVSLGERSALLAIGSDTAGSVRIPASMTGNVGMRPTVNRWSSDGIVPLSPPLDTAGPLTRNADDLALTFASIDPHIMEDPFDFTTRINAASLHDFHVGICDWFFEDCDPGIAEGVKEALDELSKKGLRQSSIKIPHLDTVTDVFANGGLHIGEFASFMNNEMSDFISDLDPTVAIRIKESENFPASEHIRRLNLMNSISAEAAASLEGFHAIVGPTLPMSPPRMKEVEDPQKHLAANFFCVRNTNPVSLMKLCAITIPVSLDRQNMPVGLQIICLGGKEEQALAIALVFERSIGTSKDRIGSPPIFN